MQHSLETIMQAFRYCLLASGVQTGEPTDVTHCDLLSFTIKNAIGSQPHSEQSRECNPFQQLRCFCAQPMVFNTPTQKRQAETTMLHSDRVLHMIRCHTGCVTLKKYMQHCSNDC